jgi:hypothetical protein
MEKGGVLEKVAVGYAFSGISAVSAFSSIPAFSS